MYQNRRFFFKSLIKAGVYAGIMPTAGVILMESCNNPHKQHIFIYGNKKSSDFYQNVARNFSSISFEEINVLKRDEKHPLLISMPLDQRGDIAALALEQGHSILTEIPPTNEYDIFSKIKQNTDISNVHLGLILFHRYLTICINAREIIHSDELGKILSVKVQMEDYKADPLFNPENGQLQGYLLHMLDLVKWLTSASYAGLHIIPTAADQIEISAKAKDFHALFSSVPLKYGICNTFRINIECEKGELGLKDAKILSLTSDHASSKVLINLEAPDYKDAIHKNMYDFLSADNSKTYHQNNLSDAYDSISLKKAIHKAQQTNTYIELEDVT